MSIHAKKPSSTTLQVAAEKTGRNRSGVSQPSTLATSHAVDHALELIRRHDYAGGAGVLIASGYNPQVRDLLGICLMRSGQFEQALQVYRQLVLLPGGVLERAGINDTYKRNFATALLLRGLPSGALEVLAAMHDSESLRAVQIRAAIVRWEKTLQLFRWLDWKLNKIEPTNCRIPIDFEPGEMEFDTVRRRPDGRENRLAA